MTDADKAQLIRDGWGAMDATAGRIDHLLGIGAIAGVIALALAGALFVIAAVVPGRNR